MLSSQTLPMTDSAYEPLPGGGYGMRDVDGGVIHIVEEMPAPVARWRCSCCRGPVVLTDRRFAGRCGKCSGYPKLSTLSAVEQQPTSTRPQPSAVNHG